MSAVSGLGAPFVSHSGICPSSPGYTTFTAPISAGHSDPVAELTADGPATLRDAHGAGVDTGGAGTVWEPWGESLSPGESVEVEVDCNSSTDMNYTFNLYNAPSTPFSVSGAVTNCTTCSPQNDIQFSASETANYVADLTLTQGGVRTLLQRSFTGAFGPGRQRVAPAPYASTSASKVADGSSPRGLNL